MARIVFIMDIEEGHFLPSFGLAHSLKDRGHEVCYLGVIDNAPLVAEQGFDFHPVLKDIYHQGYKEKYKQLSPPPGDNSLSPDLKKEYDEHIAALMAGAYDPFLEHFQSSLLVISTFLKIDTLVLHYKYNICPVIFTPFLREASSTPAKDCLNYLKEFPVDEIFPLVDFVTSFRDDFTSLAELVAPLDNFCELIACPHELDVDDLPARANAHYIGPSIRKETCAGDIASLYRQLEGKKIIYASLGSQPLRHGAVRDLFFRKMICVMKEEELQDCHLILTVGDIYDIDNLAPLPDNVTVLRWVSQISILKRASLAVIHGGLGSVKECIYYGVPMIVFPLGYDQPVNARRVAHHNLGLTGDIGSIPEGDLKVKILQALGCEHIRASVRNMQQLFHEKECANQGADIIEALLRDREMMSPQNNTRTENVLSDIPAVREEQQQFKK